MSHKVPPQRHQDLFALPHLSAINPDVPARRIDVSTYRRHRKHALLILLHTSLLANRQKINKPWKPERCCIVNVNPSWVDCWSLTYPVRIKILKIFTVRIKFHHLQWLVFIPLFPQFVTSHLQT